VDNIHLKNWILSTSTTGYYPVLKKKISTFFVDNIHFGTKNYPVF
jgi:hypothetical protein